MRDKEHTPVYYNSLPEAKRLSEVEDWKASHRENIACKNFIEQTIRDGHDGTYLQSGCAERIIDEYGFHRTSFVMANSVMCKLHDGRFSDSNKTWAKEYFFPDTAELNFDFAVDSHPYVFNGVINQYHREFEKLQLLDIKSIDTEDGEYKGKVIAVKASELHEKYLSLKDQIYLATDGFGCDPGKSGRAVYATCLGDGERVKWNRHEILGVVKEECIPAFALEKLAELEIGRHSQDMGGMDMT